MNSKIVKFFLATLLALLATAGGAQDSTGDSAAQDGRELSHAVRKSMDPNVWIKLMNSMMSGELQGQPAIASCVECHTDEDVARYQQDFGGMLHAMNPMMQMLSPQGFTAYANGMTAPMTAMINPMTGMMTPMMGMVNPMTGMMMAPVTGMMNPMTGMMTNPMTGMMMNPMTGMMMNPMTGMMLNPMTGMMMNPMTGMMMNPMTGMMPGMTAPGAVLPPIGGHSLPGMPQMPQQMPGMGGGGMMPQGMMDPGQYEKFYRQWTEMMSKMSGPQSGSGGASSQ